MAPPRSKRVDDASSLTDIQTVDIFRPALNSIVSEYIFRRIFELLTETYLSHDAFIVDVEAELPQAVSAKRHL